MLHLRTNTQICYFANKTNLLQLRKKSVKFLLLKSGSVTYLEKYIILSLLTKKRFTPEI